MEEKKQKKEPKENSNNSQKQNKSSLTNSLRNNVWIVSTIVLALILVFVLVQSSMNRNSTIPGYVISENNAQLGLKNFLDSQTGGQAQVNEIKEYNNYLYQASISYMGQNISLYLTKDGKYLAQLIPLKKQTQTNENTPQQTQSIPKSDKPKVELFVMAYCPYGTQAEKGFIPAIKALGNTIDAQIRFVHYFMHGEKEEAETYRQLCIREEQPDKYLDYLKCFLEGDGNAEASGYIANGKDSEVCMNIVGVDKNKVNTCISNGKAKEYYKIDSELSKKYGIRGSPTLVLNDVRLDSVRESDGYYYHLDFGNGAQKIKATRDSASYLKTICNGFNNAPNECNVNLSTSESNLGFGWGDTDNSNTASAQCG